ncbi:hypothetical protein LSH36_22g07018 [Paralvinella palmiformis]|uniref:Antistasin-like domain-containing protein n=1 Tax=Paralvinella palmiformis TaxID=53620 RepID=A0AAD9KA49_9ANNE|nr:hypothetical protein LSH36_22g07018 [Paralvinella palmiformis]
MGQIKFCSTCPTGQVDLKSIMKILYTDYNTALVYTCNKLIDSRHCAAGEESLAVYTRFWQHYTDVLDHLDHFTENTCYRKMDMEPVSHIVTCQLPISNKCLVRNIPTENDFNLDKFQGTWYSLYQLRAEHVTSGLMLHVDRGSDHIIRLYNTAASTHGCIKTNMREIDEPRQDHVASWILDRYNYSGVFKIIATDYYHSVVYKCRELAEDGTCKPGLEFVDIISRVKMFPSEDIQKKLFRHTRLVCKERGEFVPNDLSVNCPMSATATKQCSLDDIPVVENFDSKKFEGVWYTYAKLRTISHYDYMTTIIKRGPNGALIALNYPASQGHCIKTYEKTMQPIGDPNVADFMLNGGRVRIAYTDYNYALLIGCQQVSDDGSCVSGQNMAVVYSRTKDIPQISRQIIVETASKCCLSETDLRITTQHVPCPVTYSGRHSCHFDDVMIQENFTFSKADCSDSLRTLNGLNCADVSLNNIHPSISNCLISVFVKDSNVSIIDMQDSSTNGLHCDKMYGTWHLLAKTGSGKNQPTIVKFMKGHNNLTRYAMAQTLVDGSCFTSIAYIKPDNSTPATYSYRIGNRNAITKVIYLTSSYLVEYDCQGSLLDTDGVCPPGREQIEVWGRSSFVTESIVRQILHGIEYKTCVSVDEYKLTPTPEVLCKLPIETCNIYKFVEPEDFNIKSIYGGWQLLSRTTLVPTKAISKSILYYSDMKTGELRYADAGSMSSGECYNTDGKFFKDPDHKATYITTTKNEQTVITRILYVTKDHLITMSCNEKLNKHGVCYYGNSELSIFGKTLKFSDKIRKRLIKFAEERTLACVPTVAMMDVPSNDNCQISADYCSSRHFDTPEQYDQRMLYGEWHVVMRTTFKSTPFISQRIIFSHGLSDNMQYATGILLNTGECVKYTGAISILSSTMATYHIVYPNNIFYDSKVLFVSADHLIIYSCFGGWDAEQNCPLERTIVNILSRDQELDARDINQLQKIVRQETLSCIPTSMFVTMRPTDCDIDTPQDYQSCALGDIKEMPKLDAQKLAGVWYQIARSDYITERVDTKLDGVMMTIKIERNKLLYKATGYLSSQTNQCIPDSSFMTTFKPGNAGIQQYMHTGVNSVKYAKNSCIVNEIPVQKDFKQDQFVGVWYEVERTRFTSDNIWESIVSHFNPLQKHYIRLTVSGTRGGKCMGPFEAHLKPATSAHSSTGDMTMWLGSQDSYGHPWTVNMKYKVIYTDYQTAIVYTCRHVNTDGTCPKRSQQVDILSRQRDIDPDKRSKMHDIIKEKLCLSPADFVIPANEGDCIEFVRPTSVNPDNFNMSPESKGNKCPDLQCSLYCEDGLVKDASGCDICQCKKVNTSTDNSNTGSILPGAALCRVPICLMYCEHGYQKDQHGCDTCQCVESNIPDISRLERRLEDKTTSIQCAVPMCSEQCQHGYVHNEFGCMTCECKKGLPQEMNKPDNVTDRTPSPISCAIPQCMNQCQHGYADNEYGCMTCRCKQPPSDSKKENAADLITSPMCATPICANQCEHGYIHNEYGCMTCECKQRPPDLKKDIQCAIPMCENFCEHGYVYNSYGCMTCECNDMPTEFDTMLMCRPIECTLTCDQGFVKDTDGCDICECATESDNVISTKIKIESPKPNQSSSMENISQNINQSNSMRSGSAKANKSESVSTVNS